MVPSNSRFHGLGFLNTETKPWEMKANAELLVGHIVSVRTNGTHDGWAPAVVCRIVDVLDIENNRWDFYFGVRYTNGLYDRVPVTETKTASDSTTWPSLTS